MVAEPVVISTNAEILRMKCGRTPTGAFHCQPCKPRAVQFVTHIHTLTVFPFSSPQGGDYLAQEGRGGVRKRSIPFTVYTSCLAIRSMSSYHTAYYP